MRVLGFSTRGIGFLARGVGFLMRGLSFLTRGLGFLTRGLGFLARAVGFLMRGLGFFIWQHMYAMGEVFGYNAPPAGCASMTLGSRRQVSALVTTYEISNRTARVTTFLGVHRTSLHYGFLGCLFTIIIVG